MPRPLTLEQARQRAEARCAASECCRHDIREALRRWQVDAEEIEDVLDGLEREGFIDEARYARAFVHDKVHYDRWGRQKILHTLRQKQLSDHDIRAALGEIPEALYLKNLRDLLRAKLRSLTPLSHDEDEDGESPPADAYRQGEKAARYALSRGYEPHLVFQELKGIQTDMPLE